MKKDINLFDFFTPKSQTAFLESDATIRQALEKFDFHKFSVVPILDKEGHFITTVSEGDILRYIKNVASFDIHIAQDTKILDIQKYRPYSALKTGSKNEEFSDLLLNQNFIPLIDDKGIYIGILKRKSLIEFLIVNHKKIK